MNKTILGYKGKIHTWTGSCMLNNVFSLEMWHYVHTDFFKDDHYPAGAFYVQHCWKARDDHGRVSYIYSFVK